MDNFNILIADNYLIINNITNLIEFNSEEFIVEINNEAYQIKGNDLSLDNTLKTDSIKITGNINSIMKKNVANKKKESFIKRLFA